jgi:ribulose-5-phosphate 4-epimerase/fuculose-1-phosphate aldolase
MGNHGVLIGGTDVGVAFDDMWTIERACEILVKALSTGQPLNILSDEVAEKTAKNWEGITDFSRQHFEEMKSIIIEMDSSVLD